MQKMLVIFFIIKYPYIENENRYQLDFGGKNEKNQRISAVLHLNDHLVICWHPRAFNSWIAGRGTGSMDGSGQNQTATNDQFSDCR